MGYKNKISFIGKRVLISIILIKLSLLFASAFAFENQFELSANLFQNTNLESAAGKKLEIIKITPEGTNVPDVNQINFEFNLAVVPIGNMDRKQEEIPITFTPFVDCQWRWLNNSNLTCQLNSDTRLLKATKYLIKIDTKPFNKNGAKIERPKYHEFTTERPDVTRFSVSSWQSGGSPSLRVYFNQEVTKKSVEEAIQFEIFEDEEDEPYEIIGANATEFEYDYSPKKFLMFPNINYYEKNIKNEEIIEPTVARKIWVLSPKKEIEKDKRISVTINPGVRSAYGNLTSTKKGELTSLYSFPKPEFVHILCFDMDNNRFFIEINNYLPQKCNPLMPIGLGFTSPINSEEIKNNVNFNPEFINDDSIWPKDYELQNRSFDHQRGNNYYVFLPSSFKAETKYEFWYGGEKNEVSNKQIGKSKSLFSFNRKPIIKDIFGNELIIPFNHFFETDKRPPNYELEGLYSVVEKNANSDVPVYITNLEKAGATYNAVSAAERIYTRSKYYDLSESPKNIQYAQRILTKEMLNNRSGTAYGEILSNPFIKKWGNGSKFISIVSPAQVQVKLGHFNSLIWVTNLENGLPIKDAKITLYIDNEFDYSEKIVPLSEGITDENGMAILDGYEKIDPILKTKRWCSDGNCPTIFVKVEKDDDLILMPLVYDFNINIYRLSNYKVYNSTKRENYHLKAWGITDQPIYKAGSKVNYKIFVRNQSNKKFISPAKGKYSLEVKDPSGTLIYSNYDAYLSENGTLNGSFDLNNNAFAGWYNIYLYADYASANDLLPIKFLVSDFNLADFKVENYLNGKSFFLNDKIEISTSAKYYSGGGVQAKARVTAMLTEANFYSSYPLTEKYAFNSDSNKRKEKIFEEQLDLDVNGELKNEIRIKEKIPYGKILVESSIRDDRGKNIASSSRADYYSVDRFVGLLNTKWIYEIGKEAEIKSIVVDKKGIPQDGTGVTINIQHKDVVMSKVKTAGNSYKSTYKTNWKYVTRCKFISKKDGDVCKFTPKKPGSYRVIATIKDSKGNKHSSQINAYVYGSGYVLWDDENENLLEIAPEKSTYKIGEKAKILIKNPFPNSSALITIERYGILKSWVKKIDDSAAFIEFDIEEEFAPGFYLSVSMLSPRTSDEVPEIGQIDLGKPDYRMGYLKFDVEPNEKLLVDINMPKNEYRPRENVKINISTKNNDGKIEDNVELAAIVIDEALLDLNSQGEKYYDPIAGFYKLENLDVENYSLLKQLIGQRNFEKKGANSGGDGGSDFEIRNDFKFVAYWNPSIKLDKNGMANFNFDLPDNLTNWKIFVIAVNKDDKMGVANKDIKVSSATEIRKIMPNHVFEGDEFKAGFSIFNRYDKERELNVNINITGDIEGEKIISKKIKIPPFSKENIFIPIKTKKINKRKEVIKFSIKAFDNLDNDYLVYEFDILQINNFVAVAQSDLLDKEKDDINFKIPNDIDVNRSAIKLNLSTSIIGNLEGVFENIYSQNYESWENYISKSVTAAYYQKLEDYLDGFIWEEVAKDVNLFKNASNYQNSDGGMVYFKQNSRYSNPYLSAYTAYLFNLLEELGQEVDKSTKDRLNTYLDDLLRNKNIPSHYNYSMRSSLTSVILASNDRVSIEDLYRYKDQVEKMDLFGKAMFLLAASKFKDSGELAQDVYNMIMNNAVQSSGKISFTEDIDLAYLRMLSSDLRTNCVILSAFTSYANSENGKKLVSDKLPKIVKFIIESRGQKNHWENNQENVFCLKALYDYANKYETKNPKLNIKANFANISMDENFVGLKNENKAMNIPLTQSDLGKEQNLSIKKNGEGNIYYNANLKYYPNNIEKEAVNHGVEIIKELSVEKNGKWKLLKNNDKINKGDIVRVDIFVSVPTAANFLLVDDPIAGGFEPINKELATTSIIDLAKNDKDNGYFAGESVYYKYDGFETFNRSIWGFYHHDLKFDASVFYSEYLTAGNYYLSYMVQAIANGKFIILPAKAFETYNPDIFGTSELLYLEIDE